jgi:hypothetical protein
MNDISYFLLYAGLHAHFFWNIGLKVRLYFISRQMKGSALEIPYVYADYCERRIVLSLLLTALFEGH